MVSLYKLHASTFALFFFFFFCIFTLQHLSVATATCHKNDMAGLLGFKSGITADPSGVLQSWIPGTDCCEWQGVNCMTNNRVTSLEVYRQRVKPDGFLTGTISSSLSKLKHLNSLYLMELNFSGPFPTSILSLKNLENCYIEYCNLSGPLPPNIGLLSKLQYFGLSGNRFSGRIPSSISNLTQLQQLKLPGNLLTGAIPASLNQLKSLYDINLEGNRFTGPIPDLSSLSNLFVLLLSGNKLSGQIPSTLSAHAPSLTYLELDHNNFSGKIPDFLGKFSALNILNLSWNRFSGAVPTTFANLTKIVNLDLSHNFLVDPFPQMYVKGIESLDLSYNEFHLGQIPKWVTSSPIISLKLAKCGIKMKLEKWKPETTHYYNFIDLSDNQISGSPIRLLNQTNFLVEFSVSRNLLKFNMKNLKFPKTLKKLDLSRNLVFGNLRKSISGVKNLNVSYNHLCGPIPATNFTASVFVGNDCLCGSPLSPCKAR